MTERENWRQAGDNARPQDGLDDGTWAFYAADAASLGAFLFDLNTGTPVIPPGGARPSLAQYQQIVFIEGNVPDARQLAAGVAPGTLAVILNPSGDGVAQIAAFLASHDIKNLAAIDIVAHGADGTVQLGTGTLSSATLAQYQTELTTIGAALGQGGNIQLFGCDVAQDATGVAFMDQLSTATGGANVAASSHLVGAASGGGSWDLNVNTGSIDVASPFTATTESAYPAELPIAGTSELFLAFNVDYVNGGASIEKMAVSGSSTATGVTSLANSATNTSLSNAAGILGLVVEDPQGRYYVVDDDAATGHGSTNQIMVGTFGSGSLAAPSYLDFSSSSSLSPWGVAESANPNVLYLANYDTTNTALNGIWEINVNTGSAAPVAYGTAAVSPLELAIDQQNSLGFFTSDDGTTSDLEVGNLATGHVQVLEAFASADTPYGIAVNAGTVYYDLGYDGATSGIYSATYSLSNGTVTLGAIKTLYSIAQGGSVDPTSLVIDPTNNVFYVGNAESANYGAWSVWEGSLAGSTVAQPNLIEVSATGNNTAIGPETEALDVVTTPTVATSGTATYVQGNAAALLDPGATASNRDNQGLASASVQILSGTTNDVLSAITAGTSITASYTAATQTLTLTGADTAADYQTVLDSVAFSTTGTAGTRTIDWTISDGSLSSTTTTSTVDVTARETVVAGATVSFTGGGPAVTLDSGLTMTDPSSSTLAGATVVIGGFISGDTLTVGTQGGLSQSFNNGTLTLTGSASLATYQAALELVAYATSPSDADPTGGGSHTSRTISWSVNDGTVASAPVTSTLNEVHVAGTVTASGTVTYTGPTPVTLDPAVTVTDADSGGDLTGATISVGGGFSNGDTLVFTNQNGITGSYDASSGVETLAGTTTLANYQTALESVAFDTTNASTAVRTIDWTTTDGVAASNTSTSTVDVICFRAGTMIGTPAGEVPVQTLKPGDTVLTAHNGPRPVRWVGKGRVLATRGRRTAATPVIVRKGALADNVPTRDLHITKAHSLYIDGVLIPVEFLVNSKTIHWDDRAQEVEIYHIELDSHDVLLANGTPAESFRDDGNRWLFQNARPGWDLPPQEPCAPVLTGGPIVDAMWKRLLERAGPRKLPPLTDDPDLHLVVDGTRIDPEDRRGPLYGFRLPCRPSSVVLGSRSGVPAELGTVRDPRSLGVALRRVTVQQGRKFMLFDADDERLTAGFHGYEPADRLRWTDGSGALPGDVFAGFDKGAEVMVQLGGATRYPDFGVRVGREAA